MTTVINILAMTFIDWTSEVLGNSNEFQTSFMRRNADNVKLQDQWCIVNKEYINFKHIKSFFIFSSNYWPDNFSLAVFFRALAAESWHIPVTPMPGKATLFVDVGMVTNNTIACFLLAMTYA